MDAATSAARRRNKESRPKTRPRSSSCPDLTSIKVVAVIRLRGTWVRRMLMTGFDSLLNEDHKLMTTIMTIAHCKKMKMMTKFTRNKLMIVDL